jgi:hypothetical protein
VLVGKVKFVSFFVVGKELKKRQKKTLPRLLDRDKTKNKHYEQTLSYIKNDNQVDGERSLFFN